MALGKTSAFTGVIEKETAKAYYFVFDFEYDAEWLPKSQTAWTDEGKDQYGERRGTMAISSWLCEQNGWVETVDTVDLIDRGDRK